MWCQNHYTGKDNIKLQLKTSQGCLLPVSESPCAKGRKPVLSKSTKGSVPAIYCSASASFPFPTPQLPTALTQTHNTAASLPFAVRPALFSDGCIELSRGERSWAPGAQNRTPGAPPWPRGSGARGIHGGPKGSGCPGRPPPHFQRSLLSRGGAAAVPRGLGARLLSGRGRAAGLTGRLHPPYPTTGLCTPVSWKQERLLLLADTTPPARLKTDS